MFGTQKMASDVSFWCYVVAVGLFAMILALLATRYMNSREAVSEKLLMEGRPSELSVHSVEEIVTDLGGGEGVRGGAFAEAGETISPLLESATLVESGEATGLPGQAAGVPGGKVTEVSVVVHEDDEEDVHIPMEI